MSKQHSNTHLTFEEFLALADLANVTLDAAERFAFHRIDYNPACATYGDDDGLGYELMEHEDGVDVELPSGLRVHDVPTLAFAKTVAHVAAKVSR